MLAISGRLGLQIVAEGRRQNSAEGGGFPAGYQSSRRCSDSVDTKTTIPNNKQTAKSSVELSADEVLNADVRLRLLGFWKTAHVIGRGDVRRQPASLDISDTGYRRVYNNNDSKLYHYLISLMRVLLWTPRSGLC